MASNINPMNINGSYPIAGQDNDSQGFRDNFSVIKNNFEASKSEIEDLQLNTARLDDSNDFNKNTITNVNLSSYSEELYNGGSVSSTPTLVEIGNGPYQIFTVNPLGSSPATFQFTVTGFTDFGEKLVKFRMQIFKGTSNPSDVTVNILFDGAGAFKYSKNFPDDIILSTSPSTSSLIPAGTTQKDEVSHVDSPIILEFWSYDSGATVFCNYLGQFA